MKHILFVNGLNTEEDKQRIQEYMDNTRLDYTISTITKSVTIEGANDNVHVAKQAILSAGYSVE